MNLDFVQSTEHLFSVVLFVLEEDWQTKKNCLASIAHLEHVNLIVQPCPYEGIEFLYNIPFEFPDQEISLDREVFWHALRLPVSHEQRLRKIAQHHYQFLVSILQQDKNAVAQERQRLASLLRPL